MAGFEVILYGRFWVITEGSPSLAKVVNVTTPPGAGKSWVYTDALDRVIQTQGRSFEGGFTIASTSYDAFGRVSGTLKPRLSSESSLLYPSTISYDGLGRVKQEDRNVGPLQGGDPLAVGAEIVKTTYQGSGILTEHRVNGTLRARYEKKNVLGKVALVKVALDGDTPDSAMKFLFDAEGNLTDTKDSLLATANTIHIEYDARGRKRLSRDPDLGEWTHAYNGFGDLILQTDAKGNKTTMAYDVLGRMIRKTELADTASESVSQWIYDVAPGAGRGKLATMVGAPDTRLAGSCDIRGATLTDGKRTGRWFDYNEFGAVVQTQECTDGSTFTTNFEYDAFGRQSLVRYPSVMGERLVVRYNYTGLGFLHYVSDATTSSTLWAVSSMNALGQVTAEVTGSGVQTLSERNRATGWLQGSTSTAFADNNNLIQSWTYRYDEAGNLRTRLRQDKVNVAESTEYFGYDRLERLNYATVEVGGNSTTQWYLYDRLGNLTEKAGKTYTYSGCATGGGPHAVCTVGTGSAFSYDPNGNMTIGGDRTLTYNPSNKVIRVDSHPATSLGNDTGVVDFIYGADGGRVVQEVTGGPSGVAPRTVYVGMGGTGKSLYERTRRGTTDEFEHVQFIYAGGAHGGNAFAVRSIKQNGASAAPPALKYYHFDHLGSVAAMSDESGRVVDAAWGGANAGVLGYDAWGARRNPDGTAANPASFNPQVGHREFTGHETIPNVGLVNMNGRVYDPVLGRFLSPDPTIQFAADLQSYNRYSYVLNNPLRYSDPTGYSISGWDIARTGLGLALGVAGAAVCAYSAGVGCVVFGLWAASMQGVVAVASGASWDQAATSGAIGFMSGMAFGAIGGAVAQGYGGELGAQLVGGAISGALGGAMTTALGGGSAGDIGKNLLIGAATGAAMAGVSHGFKVSALSQASAAQGGGGSGAARMEKAETVDSVLAEAGYGGRQISDDELLGSHPGSPEFQADHAQAVLERAAAEGDADAAGAIVRLLKNGGMKVIRELTEKADAVMARRQGQNVLMKTDQAAHQVEKAAFGGEDLIRHKGHDLANGQKGLPHYQTGGQVGHTFWGSVAAFVASFLNPFDAISGQLGCPAGEACYQRPGL